MPYSSSVCGGGTLLVPYSSSVCGGGILLMPYSSSVCGGGTLLVPCLRVVFAESVLVLKFCRPGRLCLFWRGLAASSAIHDSAAQRNTSSSSCGSKARDSLARRRFLTPALQVGLFLTTC